MCLLIKKTLNYLIYPMLLITFLSSAVAANKDHSAGEIYTEDTWLYGKYVFRMRVAEGSAVLSNFFLWKPDSQTSWIDWEEVDIEVFGKDGATSWQSNIITSADGWTTSGEIHENSSSFSDAYHTFSIEWTPDHVAWYIDDEELRRTTSEQTNLLINASSPRFSIWASNNVAWVGSFDDSILPVHMYINWLEYYSWNGEGFDLDWRDDFDSLDTNRWSEAEWTFSGNYADFVAENVNIDNGYLVLSLTNAGEEGFSGSAPLDLSDIAIEKNNNGISCSYDIISEWSTAFVAEISITNNTNSLIDGWSTSWEYNDDSSVMYIWNAQLFGEGPYTANNLSINSTIAQGEAVSFRFLGEKGSTDATIATIQGGICD